MKRKIVQIDERLCNGCGLCVPGCAEGAIRLGNGKARLVAENLCDGLGACLGECPEGAITIEVRDADAFDGKVVETDPGNTDRGPAPAAHGEHPGERCHGHHVNHESHAGGFSCPSSRAYSLERLAADGVEPVGNAPSELTHWPVKLQLVSPTAPFFSGKELVVAADCAPVACGDFHQRFLKGNAVVIQCPKICEEDLVLEKLAGIISNGRITGLTVVRMEVPCCGALYRVVQKALQASGRSDLVVREVVTSVRGDMPFGPHGGPP